MSARIPESEWVWCGYAGHFIGGYACRMHLCTRVGDYRISTVGDYYPREKRERIGAGADSFYETYVFTVSGEGEHGEGDVTEWAEIDGERYAEGIDAERGHMRYCDKYAQIEAEVAA